MGNYSSDLKNVFELVRGHIQTQDDIELLRQIARDIGDEDRAAGKYRVNDEMVTEVLLRFKQLKETR